MDRVDIKTLSKEELMIYLEGGEGVVAHIETLVRERRLKLMGDDSHSTFRYIRDAYANVDKPRKYAFQPENYHEQEVIRLLTPEFYYGVLCHPAKVIAGEQEVRFNLTKCSDCGTGLSMRVCSDTVTITGKTECQSNSVYDVKIHFPTGELMTDDWVDGLSAWKEKNEDLVQYEYGNDLGATRRYSERWAAQNVGHFFVGNTCPSIVLREDGCLSIRPDEDNDPGEELTSICTDLWWVTMIDVATWQKMMDDCGLGKQEIRRTLAEASTIKIKAGYWNFRYETILEGDGIRRVTATWLHY